MEKLKGYRTVIAMGLAIIVALYQTFVGPLPEIDSKVWNVLVPSVALAMRFITTTPVGGAKS